MITPNRVESPRPRRRGRRALWISLGAVVAVTLIGYAFTFAPHHYAWLVAKTATEDTSAPLGHGAQVTAGEGWTIEPLVTPLLAVPQAPQLALSSWSVLAPDAGVRLHSPDRGLMVDITAHAATAGAATADAPAAPGVPAAEEERRETLASGLPLRHRDTDEGVTATVGDRVEVRVRATAADGAIDPYRPALSALLESIAIDE